MGRTEEQKMQQGCKGAGTADEGQLFQSKHGSEAGDGGEVTHEMGRTEEKKQRCPPSPLEFLEKYAMNLEMTPNLEDCNVKKEQVLQTEDSCFNPNMDQKLETGRTYS